MEEQDFSSLQDGEEAEQSQKQRRRRPLIVAAVVLLFVLTGVVIYLCLRHATPDVNPNYDMETATRFVKYSYAAYCPAQAIQQWTCKWCQDNKLTDVTLFSSNATDGYGFVGYYEDKNEIIVSFRGSHTMQNWIENLDLRKTDEIFAGVPDAYVHDGFYQTYISVRTQLLTSVNKLVESHPHANIWTTGHSLGGALATLAAVDFPEKHGLVIPSLYTFGSPRVGNEAFASFVDGQKKTALGPLARLRVVNKNDVVPHIPLEQMDFHHVTSEVWLTSSGSVRECSSSNGEDPTCSNSISISSADISDHLNYFDLQEDCEM